MIDQKAMISPARLKNDKFETMIELLFRKKLRGHTIRKSGIEIVIMLENYS